MKKTNDWIQAIEAYAMARAPVESFFKRWARSAAAFLPGSRMLRGPHATCIDKVLVDADDASRDAVLALQNEAAIEAVLTLMVLPLRLPLDSHLDWTTDQLSRQVVKQLMRRRLPWTQATICALARCGAISLACDPKRISVTRWLALLQAHDDGTQAYRDAVQQALDTLEDRAFTVAVKKVLHPLKRLAGGESASSLLMVAPDCWGTAVIAWHAGLPEAQQRAWQALFEHANSLHATRPSAKWSKRGQEVLEPVREGFTEVLIPWMFDADLTPDVPQLPRGQTPGMVDVNRALFKGLLFIAALHDDHRLPAAIADFGLKAYVKVPQVGARSKILGNTVINVLSTMPNAGGVAQLTRMRSKVRYNQARTQIDRSMLRAAKVAGISPQALQERTVPTFGLEDGSLHVAIGEYQAVLSLDERAAVTLTWRKPNGKLQKTVPKTVRENHPAQLKSIRATRKELLATVDAQTRRVENLWLTAWTAPVDTLLEHYLEHPVVRVVARRLLWEVDGQAVFWSDGALRDLGGATVTTGMARLWHPANETESQLIWRDRFEELGVQQPFAQLWRPVYPPTPTSLRCMAGRVLHQRALLDRCQRLGWHYQIQGQWDGLNDPVYNLPDGGLALSLGAEPFDLDDSFVYRHLISGPVVIQASPISSGPIAPEDLDPIVFSELMHQADRLVSGSMVHTLPEVLPNGVHAHDLLFPVLSPLAQSRAPVLRIALERTTLELAVQGSWLVSETARAHLGTGAVQIQGVHVPISATKKHLQAAARVLLPHQGDPGMIRVLAQGLCAMEHASSPS